MARRSRSLASLVALSVLVLIVYASLYPFSGWRWPAGSPTLALLTLPWPARRDISDEVLNVLGYVPLGMALMVLGLRRGHSGWASLMMAIALPSVLSYAMELTQCLLPMRVPSLRDWVCNALGATLGALLAALLDAIGWLQRWRAWRDHWFARQTPGALILLGLWPAGLLFPTPIPFGLGDAWSELGGSVIRGLSALNLGLNWGPSVAPRIPLSGLAEVAAVALGLLGPMSLAAASSHPGRRRVPLMLMVAVMGVVGMTVSTALNFGPSHAAAWLTPAGVAGVVLGLLLSGLLLWPGRRLAAALGLLLLSSSVALVLQAPADAYFTASLQLWEQGRFIGFHGLAQWIGWFWPYAAILWLLLRFVESDSAARSSR